MSDLGNKEVFARNLKFYLVTKGVSQAEVCKTLNIKPNSFSDWINAKTYPRIDKIEMLANYFGIKKSDLIESKKATELTDDIELQEYLESLKNRSEMRMLFKLTKSATKEDVMKAVKIIEALKGESEDE